MDGFGATLGRPQQMSVVSKAAPRTHVELDALRGHEEERGVCHDENSAPAAICAAPEEDEKEEEEEEELRLGRVREAVVGRYHAVPSPLLRSGIAGVYADYTASGRALSDVEDFIRGSVLPFYGNTHTSASYAGLQSSAFLDEARQRVAEACNARTQRSDAHSDIVLFTGAGATCAINHLVNVLRPAMGAAESCVVFVGPAEHHSNLLPWRESGAEVVEVPLDPHTSTVCIPSLRRMMQERSQVGSPSSTLLIGAFTACSNVTGMAERVDAIAKECRRFGALCCIDAASAASSLPIDMNPGDVPGGIDAIAFSGHKIPGGVGSPGVLILKKRLLRLEHPPTRPGGGTVFFVTSEDHRYLSQRDEREEGGSRDLVGIVRLAIALQVKMRLGSRLIAKREERLVRNVVAPILEHPNVRGLGPGVDVGAADEGCGRLPVASFLVAAPSLPGESKIRFLHYGFVCALLNDLFGVQTRGGCVCSGPFAHQLLQISKADSADIERLMIEETEEVLRPGFTRLSLNYLASDAEAAYVAQAVAMVASHGWKLLPHYQYIHKTGEWKHKSRARSFPERRWLASCAWPNAGTGTSSTRSIHEDGVIAQDEEQLEAMWRRQLEDGRRALEDAAFGSALEKLSDAGPHITSAATSMASGDAERLRWFFLPGEAIVLLKAQSGKAASELRCAPGTELAGPIDPLRFQKVHATGVSMHGAERETCPLSPADHGGQSAAAEGSCRGPDVRSDGLETADERPQPQPAGHVTHAEAASMPQAHPTSSSRVESRKYPLRGASQSAGEAQPGDTIPSLETLRPVKAISLPQGEAPVPSQKLLKRVIGAICEWRMIRDGDRVVVGLSGGKDSLCLLHCLLHIHRTRKPPIKFDLAACTIDPGADGFNPKPLIPYLAALGVPYHFVETPIMQMASDGHMQGDSICAFCSRMKRGALYSCCRENGYNVLALGQHLDDLAESFVMSMFHNGKMRTMKASYTIDSGDLRVIRPLVNVRESATREFSFNSALPVIDENCPACFSAPQERHHVKKLLAKEESLFPNLYSCIARAMAPLFDPLLEDAINAWIKERKEKAARARAKPKMKPCTLGNGLHGEGVPGESGAKAHSHGEEPHEGSIACTSALDEFSTDDLIAELARRGSQDRRKPSQAPPTATAAHRHATGDAARWDAGANRSSAVVRSRTESDAELCEDLSELQRFCSSESCARRP